MIKKTKEKNKAILLRKKGLSYREILEEIPVAKSTLSLWLRNVGLSKKQKQRLTKKKLIAMKMGAEARRNQRIVITKEIKRKAIKDINKLNKRDLWLIGTALYWAEGAKQKDHNVSERISFGNSDARMIKLFLYWLLRILKISKEDICFRIFLHESSENRLKEVREYWSEITNFPMKDFQKITWKRHKINSKRKNIGKNYYGLLEVRVKKSTYANRKIDGWIEGIHKQCRVV